MTTTKTTSTYGKCKERLKPTKSSQNSKEKPEPTKSTKRTTISVKRTTPKDNGKSPSKATSTVSMKKITTGKSNATPDSAERLSYYDRWVYITMEIISPWYNVPVEVFFQNREEVLSKN